MIRARVKPRRFDEKRGCYVYDVNFKTGVKLTPRTSKVAEAFGLGLDDDKEQTLLRDFEVKLREGDVVYITGESGSGKSVLLHALREDLGDKAIDISEVAVDEKRPLIDTLGGDFKEALNLLIRVGLNDAYLFLRRYPELSDGQKYRYRFAKLLDSRKKFWLADEFCSTLDRTTARIVAFNLQKHARIRGATLIVATSHTDLAEDLNPSITIRKGWGDEVTIKYAENLVAPECTASRGITIREGSKRDYEKLSSLHYRDTRLPVPIKIFAAEKEGEIIGVIAYSYPSIRAAGRVKAVGYSPSIEKLNRDWAVVSRVIVHPKYRTTGLGTRLLRETLPLAGRSHIELIAVMAEYNPFAARAGMDLITITRPNPTVTAAVEALRQQGFSPPLMPSKKHCDQTINNQTPEGIEEIKKTLLTVDTLYLKRVTSSAKPYLSRAEAATWLDAQPPARLTRCIQNLAVLNQSKAYLHWTRGWSGNDGKNAIPSSMESTPSHGSGESDQM